MKGERLGQSGALLLSAAAVVASVCSARAEWVPETVGTAGSTYARSSLAIDAVGDPHVAYVDTSDWSLKYAKHIGGIWQVESVASDPSGLCVPSLALDSQGRPHIAFLAYGASRKGLYYTHWTGTAWQAGYVAGDSRSTQYPSLRLTSADEPRIAFCHHTDNGDQLYYAVPGGSSWSIQHVYGSGYGWGGGTPALALDANDYPRVGWGYYGQFGYLWSDGGPWSSEWPFVNVEYTSNSLVLDSANEAHVVFCNPNYTLNYARRSGSVWSSEIVVGGGAHLDRLSLALDSHNRPCIAFVSTTGQVLKSARRTTSWCIETVDDTTPCAYASLAFDAADIPHITYYGAASPAVKYARWDPVGDLDCSGCVNFGDINPFVLALTNPAGYQQAFPNCNIMNADINHDGRTDFGDINPFVRLLTDP